MRAALAESAYYIKTRDTRLEQDTINILDALTLSYALRLFFRLFFLNAC